MFRRRTKPINKKLLFIRVYVSVMTVILAASLVALLSQSVEARERTPSVTQTAQMPEREKIDIQNISAADDGEGKNVTRADSVIVHYHGQTMRTSGNGDTAGELLKRLGLELSGEDMVSCGLEEITRDGMEIFVDRIVTCRESYTTALSCEVRRCTDATLPEGTEQVLLEGTDGEMLCTARVTYKNGIEAERTVLSRTVTKQPVTGIIGVGSARNPDTEQRPVIGDGYIRLPTGELLTYTKTATVRATAYTQTDPGCDGLTATGTNVRRGAVAVDPRYIPYGTRMFVMTPSGSYIYGIAVAEDCGGDIKGDRMDLYLPTYEECLEFGRRVCTVYFLG